MEFLDEFYICLQSPLYSNCFYKPNIEWVRRELQKCWFGKLDEKK